MVDALASGASVPKGHGGSTPLSRTTFDNFFYKPIYTDHRGVAQWLARSVRDAEVGGSSPLTPTNRMARYLLSD